MIERTVSIQIQEHRETFLNRGERPKMGCEICGISKTETQIYPVYVSIRGENDIPQAIKVCQFCEPCFENRSE